ncbi:MAG TPA: aldo/keto reductase [Alkalispirochaeta sp.]|nr:aldo/keto reductase [Alkalispirochaeta sp.]
MKYRTFGSTGLKLSEICFGTWRYASPTGKADARSEAGARALRLGLDAGITTIHSSHEYGTRWLTGEVLKDHPRRADLHHIIKVNEPDFGEGGFDRTRFRAQIERALAELHTDQIAIVQHLQRGSAQKATVYTDHDDAVRRGEFDRDRDDLFEESERLKQEGKIAALASFPYTVGFASHAIESGIYDGIVTYFNILETEWLDLFPAIEACGMGVIGIRPLCAGLLTDTRIERSALPDGDRLADSAWDGKYEQLAAIRAQRGADPSSWSRYAIAASLAHPLVATTTLSINNEPQLTDALAATEGAYPSVEELQRIHALNQKIWSTP